MIIKYKVYNKLNSELPVVSITPIEKSDLRAKNKYVGKKANIEAVFRTTGIKLDEKLSTQDIKNYITENFWGKPEWRKYHDIFQQVRNEKVLLEDNYQFLCDLEVTLNDKMKDSGRIVSTNPEDERIIYMITSWMIGNDIKSYKSLLNPIDSINIITSENGNRK